MATALDKNDVGTYAIIDNTENSPTDKYLLSFSLTNGIWNLVTQLGAKANWPEGSKNPTLTILSSKSNHVFHQSTQSYLREVLGLSERDLEEAKFSCVNSPGLAFCSVIAPYISNEKLYMLFVLNDGLVIGPTPHTIKLKKLPKESVDSNSAKLDKRLIGEWQGQIDAGKNFLLL